MPRLAIIAARSGSKGLPDKNILPFCGKPLLAHTVEQAVSSGVFDHVAITSDSQHYLDIAQTAGADILIMRPNELANDLAAKPPVLKHALSEAEGRTGLIFETVADLQPTSPLRRDDDIAKSCAALYQDPSLNVVVSVSPARSSPYYTLVEADQSGRLNLSKPSVTHATRRQDIPPSYDLNGSIYFWRREALLEELPAINSATGFHLMDEACNFDIDTELDSKVTEFIAKTEFGF